MSIVVIPAIDILDGRCVRLLRGDYEHPTVYSDDPAEIKKWHEKLTALSAKIPAADHERLAAAVAEQNRQAKDRMRQDMGLKE